MKYFAIFLILVGFVGITFGQYIGDNLPPGTLYDKKIGWIFPSPLKQIQSGIPSHFVQCNGDFVLLVKYNDQPACVKPTTADKINKRGWQIILEQQISAIPPTGISSAQNLTKIVYANNQFALDFYSQITDNKKNQFFSPWSISTAFSIAYEGARGTTAEEIGDIFGFTEDDEQRRISFASIQEDLNQENAKYKLNVANALWLAPDFEPFPEYINTVKNYDSEIDTVNFAKEGVGIINDWVSTKTEGKIKELFEPGILDPRTKLVLTNAIYFNGTWVFPFDKKLTTEEDFFVNAEKKIKVQMMNHDVLFLNYTETEHMQILELPYNGDKLSMLIVLPRDIYGIKSLEESLSSQKISQWQNDLHEQKLQVKIPKFTMETEYDLVTELKKLGINSAFGQADFSGISNSAMFIDKAIHKTFVDVNEGGTEAAASTGVSMLMSSPEPFWAIHPFIFIIVDKETDNILFFGKVVDPTE